MKQRRRLRLRLRLPVVIALGFAAVVLATSMPVSALLAQHRQLSATTAALDRVQSADRALSAEQRELSRSSTAAGLARSEYGLVPPGQKAYVILPPPGASSAELSASGHVPLEGRPVVPGSNSSRQLLGLGGEQSSSSTGSGRATPTIRRPATSTSSTPRTGFWGRVTRTLEFWR